MNRRLALAAVVALAACAGLVLLRAPPDPAALAAALAGPRAFVSAHALAGAALYVLAYAAFAALSLPGVWIVSVAGGALFGAVAGPPLVCLAYTLGATAAMSLARHLLREAVVARWPGFSAEVDRGVASGGALWLIAARLTPVIPYFAVNLAAGLTPMRMVPFALATAVGALPFSCLYALAGARLAQASRWGDLWDGRWAAACLALAVAPFALRAAARRLRR